MKMNKDRKTDEPIVSNSEALPASLCSVTQEMPLICPSSSDLSRTGECRATGSGKATHAGEVGLPRGCTSRDANESVGSHRTGTLHIGSANTTDEFLLRAITNFLESAESQTAQQRPSVALLGGMVSVLNQAGTPTAGAASEARTKKIHITKKKISDIVRFVLENVGEHIELLDICKVANLSASHLCRAIKIDTGLTPYNFVLRVRVDYAQQLLSSTKLPLTEIALVCGFSSQSHFCNTFKKFIGQTPGQFRRMAAAMRIASNVTVESGSSGFDGETSRLGQSACTQETPAVARMDRKPESQSRSAETPKARLTSPMAYVR